MKSFLKEFKEFALRGNVVDLAVGVIIGGAFQAIVNSLVNDIISPIIGLFIATDFNALVITLNGVDIKIGAFITAIVNFLIMAFVIFNIVKAINKISSITGDEEEPAAPTTKVCPYCLSEVPVEAKKCAHCTSDLE